MKNKIIFFGDSIIKYKKKNKVFDWTKNLKKQIKTNSKKNYFKTFAYVGLNTRGALEILPNILKNNKNIDFILIQLGINDSWHFRSLNGKPNVSKESFKTNLNEIYSKCKSFKIKNIIFLTYHRLLKNRIEVNKKTINQNLKIYIKIIKKFCKEKNIFCIDILNETKKIKPSKICLELPDGVHLNKYGTYIYSKIIYKKLKKFYEKKI